MIGERARTQTPPYGHRGNSVVRHVEETYDDLILVGGFSKAYSSLLAFIACPTEVKDLLKVAAPPYLYSGPSPVASLATVLAGFDVNERRGDALRAELARLTHRVLDTLDRLDVVTPNHSGFPIIEIPIADHRRIDEVGRLLFDRGVYVTLAAYPLVPKDEVGFRVQLTAANTDAEVDRLIEALEELSDRGEPAACARRSPRRGVTVRRPAALAVVPDRRRAADGAVRLGAAVRRQRPRDEPARPLAGARDPRRHPPLQAGQRAALAASSRSASRSSGPATSTPTPTRACSAARCRSRRSATASTSPSTPR